MHGATNQAADKARKGRSVVRIARESVVFFICCSAMVLQVAACAPETPEVEGVDAHEAEISNGTTLSTSPAEWADVNRSPVSLAGATGSGVLVAPRLVLTV